MLNQCTHSAVPELDVVDVAPGALPADEFVLERPDGGLGQGVVQGIADGPDRGVDAFVEESLGERHRGVLGAGVVVGNQPAQAGVRLLGRG